MSLLSLDGMPQAPIGRKSHWLTFGRFQGSALHTAIWVQIEREAKKGYVHSGHLGAKHLSELRNTGSVALAAWAPESVGPLFGMSVWNFLALTPADEVWYFKTEPSDEHSLGATEYFRRPSSS